MVIVVENNMPKENWYTPNPFQAKSGISSSKWSNHCNLPLMKDEAWMQWINELEPTYKQKWMNNGIYELIMPSGRVVDVTHDWAPHSSPTVESLGRSGPMIQLEYNSATFKSYGTPSRVLSHLPRRNLAPTPIETMSICTLYCIGSINTSSQTSPRE
ncbi:hypothetical protein ACFX2G_047669 [Malus domestica]